MSTEMDLATARRCVEACAKYLAKRDESPRAAKDLREAVAVIERAAERTGPPLDPWQPIETAPPATNVLPPAPCPITPLTVLGPATLLHWATAAVFGEKVPADVQDEPLIQAIQRLREAGRMDPPLEKCPECGFGREFICGDCGFSWQPRAAD